jgi:hypothetical protein
MKDTNVPGSPWRRVDRHLPSNADIVLLWFPIFDLTAYELGFYMSAGKWHIYRGSITIQAENPPTHWAPLPGDPDNYISP